jgi:hypothetical protein
MNIAVDSLARRLRLRYLPQTATSSDNKEQVSY